MNGPHHKSWLYLYEGNPFQKQCRLQRIAQKETDESLSPPPLPKKKRKRGKGIGQDDGHPYWLNRRKEHGRIVSSASCAALCLLLNDLNRVRRRSFCRITRWRSIRVSHHGQNLLPTPKPCHNNINNCFSSVDLSQAVCEMSFAPMHCALLHIILQPIHYCRIYSTSL